MRSAVQLSMMLWMVIAHTACGHARARMPIGEIAVRDHPLLNEAQRLEGQWTFTHEGEPWFEGSFWVNGGVIESVIEADGWLSTSWSQFHFAQVTVQEDGSLLILGLYDDHIDEDVDFEMKLVFADDVLEGTVNGESYTRPHVVEGRRLSF